MRWAILCKSIANPSPPIFSNVKCRRRKWSICSAKTRRENAIGRTNPMCWTNPLVCKSIKTRWISQKASTNSARKKIWRWIRHTTICMCTEQHRKRLKNRQTARLCRRRSPVKNCPDNIFYPKKCFAFVLFCLEWREQRWYVKFVALDKLLWDKRGWLWIKPSYI